MSTSPCEFQCSHCGDIWTHEKKPGTTQVLWLKAKKALASQIPQLQDPFICENCLLLKRAPNNNFMGNSFLEKKDKAPEPSPTSPHPSISRSFSFSSHPSENLKVRTPEDRESKNRKIEATLKHPIEMLKRTLQYNTREEALVVPQPRKISAIPWMEVLSNSDATRSSSSSGATKSQVSATESTALQIPGVEDWLQDVISTSPLLNFSAENLGPVIQPTSFPGDSLEPPRSAPRGGQRDMPEEVLCPRHHDHHDDEDDIQEARGICPDASAGTESSGSSVEVEEDIELGHTTLEDLQRIEAEIQQFKVKLESQRGAQGMLRWYSKDYIGSARPTSSRDIARNAAMILKVRQYFAIPPYISTSHIPSFFRSHLRLRACMELGLFMLSNEILMAANQSRRCEIEEVCEDIFWADEEEESVSTSKWDVSSDDSSDHEFDFTFVNPHERSHTDFSAILAVVELDQNDERAFREAVAASEAELTTLVSRTQRPRLQEDPANRHTVKLRSSLREEVIAVDVIDIYEDESF